MNRVVACGGREVDLPAGDKRARTTKQLFVLFSCRRKPQPVAASGDLSEKTVEEDH